MENVTFTGCVDYLKSHMDDAAAAVDARFETAKDEIRSSVLDEVWFDVDIDKNLYGFDDDLSQTLSSFFEQREGFADDLDDLVSELVTSVVDEAIEGVLENAFGCELPEDVRDAVLDDDVCYDIRAKSMAPKFSEHGFVLGEFLGIGNMSLEDVMAERDDIEDID